MPKTCQHEGCPWPCFSNSYCKVHQYCRTDDKYKRSQEASRERSEIKRYKAKPQSVPEESIWGYKAQTEMFVDIWDNMDKPRVCPISGRKLDGLENTKLWFSCFAHILPKGRFIKYKLNPDNIMVVHPSVHTLIDQGSQIQRDRWTDYKWNLFYDKQEQLKKEYEVFIKDSKWRT